MAQVDFDLGLFANRTVPISDTHSIARVKRALAFARRPHRNTQRAANLFLKCRRWLGSYSYYPSPW